MSKKCDNCKKDLGLFKKKIKNGFLCKECYKKFKTMVGKDVSDFSYSELHDIEEKEKKDKGKQTIIGIVIPFLIISICVVFLSLSGNNEDDATSISQALTETQSETDEQETIIEPTMFSGDVDEDEEEAEGEDEEETEAEDEDYDEEDEEDWDDYFIRKYNKYTKNYKISKKNFSTEPIAVGEKTIIKLNKCKFEMSVADFDPYYYLHSNMKITKKNTKKFMKEAVKILRIVYGQKKSSAKSLVKNLAKGKKPYDVTYLFKDDEGDKYAASFEAPSLDYKYYLAIYQEKDY